MRTLSLAMLAIAVCSPALAQQASAVPLAQPPVEHAVLSAGQTPLEQLADNPAARAAVEKHLPGIFEHPAYEMIKSVGLKAIQSYSPDKITDEVLAAIQSDLDAIH